MWKSAYKDMGKFDGILLLSDCDGTLTDSRQRVSAENKEAIRYFQENGGLFTVATGRYPGYIQSFSRDFMPNAPMIASNGGLLFDLEKEEVVDAIPLADDALACFKQVLAFVFEELPTVVQLSLGGITDSEGEFVRAETVPAGMPLGQAVSLSAEKNIGDTLTGQLLAVSSSDEILKYLEERRPRLLRAFFIQEAEYTYPNMALLRERFSEAFTIVAGWDRGIECLPRDCGKGKMALRLRARLKGIHTMVAAGDYDNDIDLLKAADIGYAVDNAPDFVKRHADRITVSNEESAVAQIIRDLENSIIR